MAREFADRRDAGRRLALRLRDVAEQVGEQGGEQGDDSTGELVVLGLPRGGVPVAAEVARALRAPLDILVVGKVGVPGHEELAVGAVADDGTTVVNPDVQRLSGLTADDVDELARRQVAALARRGAELRPEGARPVDLAGRTAVVVDDGMATGATMRVALDVARARGAARVIAAAPVASTEAAALAAAGADRVVCVLTPKDFRAVGPWYADFTQVEDGEVRQSLAAARLGAPERADDP